jgi:type II secretory pathway component PulF
MRLSLNEIVAVIPPLLAFFATGIVLGIVVLVLIRQRAKAEPGEQAPRRFPLLRLVAFTLTALFAAGIVFCLVLLLVYWFEHNSSDADMMYALASLASIGAFLLGAGMLTAIPWFAGPSPGDSKSVGVSLAWAAAWTLLILGFVLSFVLFAPGLLIVCIALVTVVISSASYKHAETQQYAMLALIGAAAKRSMPLETAVAAFGHERGGWMGRRSREMAHQLVRGVPLPMAIKEAPGVLPPEAIPLTCVGHDTGALPEAIDQAIAARNLFESVWQSIVPKIGYVCLWPSLAIGIITFIMIKIVPNFQKIFKDFGMALPKTTQGLIETSYFVGNWWFLASPIWLLTVALLFYSMLRYAGWIRWDLPGFTWLSRRRHTATLLDGISLAARQQKPLANAVMQLAAGYPQPKIARQLWAAYDAMQEGVDELECLYRHGLLSKVDLALLQAAQRNGNLAWAAKELADSNRRRLIYRTNALAQMIFPPIIIAYAAVVVWIAAALFLPLVELISNLA